MAKEKLEWKDSDAPDAKGKFKDLSCDALADWLIKSRKGNKQKIVGSLNQQIAFNKKKNPTYANNPEQVTQLKNLTNISLLMI